MLMKAARLYERTHRTIGRSNDISSIEVREKNRNQIYVGAKIIHWVSSIFESRSRQRLYTVPLILPISSTSSMFDCSQ
jgi:hypothetical protein